MFIQKLHAQLGGMSTQTNCVNLVNFFSHWFMIETLSYTHNLCKETLNENVYKTDMKPTFIFSQTISVMLNSAGQ